MRTGIDSALGLRLVKQVPEALAQIPHFNHTLQFYGADAPFLDSLAHSVADALEAGDAAIVIATEAHRDGLLQRLKASGLEFATAIENGRFVLLDATGTLSKFLLQGWPDATCFAEVVGSAIGRARAAAEGDNPGVFALDEMVALLWMAGKSGAAIRLEQLWNGLAEIHSFSLLCAYPMTGFDREDHSELFLKICAEHAVVIPDETYMGLNSEEARRRNISYLQQQARALETEKVERREAEKALRRRDRELADLLENAPEAIQQTGPDQRILWANRALLKLLGYSTEDFVGHPLSEFYAHRESFDEFWERLMRQEEIYDFPADLKCQNGSTKRALIHSNGLWEDGNLIHTLSFIRDVTERNEMIEALQRAQADLEVRVSQRTVELEQKNLQIQEQANVLEATNRGLRELSARLLQVQDEERRRIARDLHDSTGQILALLSMTLSGLQTEARKFSPDLARGLAENVEVVKQASAELRTLSYLLHPPLLDEMGLESALRWYVDGFGKRSGIKVTLDLSTNLSRLSRELETAIYRIVQECLTNVHRHSESATASIRLSQYPRRITLDVKDEGKGITEEKLSKIASSGLPGVGLRGIRERIMDFHGDLEITSHTNGTHIKVMIPLDVKDRDLKLLGEKTI